MLKLGKLTDYAIAVMVQLVKEDASRSAHALSQKTGVPEPTVAKVLKMLARKKLVESERGAAGGYRLARDAAALSVADVIEAMDGPIAIVSCIEDVCGAEATCPAKGKWNPVNNAIREALHAVRLADMAASAPRKVYQIKGGLPHVLHD